MSEPLISQGATFCSSSIAMSPTVEMLEERLLLDGTPGLAGMLEQQARQYAPGEVVVKFNEGAEPQEVLSQVGLQANGLARLLPTMPALMDYAEAHNTPVEKLKAKGLSEQVLFQRAYKDMRPTEQELYRTYELELPEGVRVEDAIASLSAHSDVAYAEPNYYLYTQWVPNDPYWSSSDSWDQGYNDLWALKGKTNDQGADPMLNCKDAWDEAKGDGVIVAVIDTGVDRTHEDLENQMWTNTGETPGNQVDDDSNGYVDDVNGWDFAYDDNDPTDVYGHGTHCAGTIAAEGNNEVGIIGVSPLATIMAVKGLNDAGSGSITDLVAAIEYAVDNGADILSNSWGGIGYSEALEDAFDDAAAAGVVSVAAAGNSDGDVQAFLPARFDSVIAVAATTELDKKVFFSNYGTLIDVSAPGGGESPYIRNILSTMDDDATIATEERKVADGYYVLAGTSMACPHVAGVAALILDKYPSASVDEVRARIVAGADDIDEDNPGYLGLLGTGRVDAAGSLSVTAGPFLKILGLDLDDIYPDKTGSIVVHVKNYWSDITNVSATLSSEDENVTIIDGSATLGDIDQYETVTNSGDPFTLSLDEDTPIGQPIAFDLDLTGSGDYEKTLSFVVIPALFVNVGTAPGLPITDPFIAYHNEFCDYDNDGLPDMIYMGGALGETGATLYRNDPEEGYFVDVTTAAGLNVTDHMFTSLFLDINNDDHQDLFLGGGGYAYNQLYLSDGDGRFTNITSTSGMGNLQGFLATAWDYNNDGFVDIFGAAMGASTSFLLRNDGDNTFTNAISGSGLPSCSLYLSTPVAFDYDKDGDQDLLVSSQDTGTSDGALYRNDGDGTFTDVTSAAGIAASTWGAAAGDYDNDGDMDIYMSHEVLYRNNGNGTFTDVTEDAELDEVPTSVNMWWGSDFFDYDNDGDLDLHMTDGDSGNMLYRNDGDGTFTDVTDLSYGSGARPAAGSAAIADYNSDGAIDVHAPAGSVAGNGALLKNLIGLENNWIRIALVGTVGSKDAAGARVYVTTGDETQMREVHTGAVETQPVHLGLGSATVIDEIKVQWLSGIEQIVKDVSANQVLEIAEAPTLTISGANSVDEDAQYTLYLSSDYDSLDHWTIDWGDGSSPQNVQGNPSSVTHTYTDAPKAYDISATATVTGADDVERTHDANWLLLDPTFIVDWVSRTDFGGEYSAAYSVAVQPDGKIVAAGSGGDGLALARYKTDGSLDTSFDSDGKVTTEFGAAEGVAIQSDGKIVAAGSTGGDFGLARYNSDGSLDTSFDSDGKVTTDFGGSDYAYDVVVQSDGKIVVAGVTYSEGVGDFALARYNSDGSLDTSFDSDGKVTTDFGGSDRAYGVALQSDGKIVAAGSTSVSVRFALARYNSDGSLDTSFDSDGKVTTSIGVGTQGRDVAIQSDGKIVVAGYAYVAGTGWDFVLARYNSNGSLDTSFDTDGKLTTDFDGYDYCDGVAIQADGRIVVAGTTDTDVENFALARYHGDDGALDTSFGDGGTLMIDVAGGEDEAYDVAVQNDGGIVVAGVSEGTEYDYLFTVVQLGTDGVVTTDLGSTCDVATAVAVQSDGKIVAVGETDQSVFAVTRYNANGHLDLEFGTDGLVTTGFDEDYAIAEGVAIQSNGRIVVVGESYVIDNEFDFAVARYTTSGSLDSSFSGDGMVTTYFSDGDDLARDVAIQSDGKIVVAGSSNGDFALARYTTSGSLDTGFDSDGKLTTSFGGNDSARAVAIQADGKIVVAGYSGGDFALARYNTDGSLDTNFDSDGKVITDFGGTDHAYDLVIQSDGKIVVAGGAGGDFALARYNSDGSLDTNFDSDGKVTTNLGGTESAYGVAIESDGKIVVAGTTSSGGNYDIGMARYDTDGSLDEGFGDSGTLVLDFGSDEEAYGLAVQSDGRTVICGYTDDGDDLDFLLLRYGYLVVEPV